MSTDASKVIEEIKKSEKTYASNIAILNQFIQDINSSKDKNARRLKESPEGAAFLAEMEKLQAINNLSQLLSPKLNAETPITSLDVANIFGDLQLNFESYSAYIASQDKINKLYASLKNNNENFIKLEKEFQSNKDKGNGQLLGAFIIMPIQRVPRHVLLLKELLRKQDASEEAALEPLKMSLQKVENAASFCNEFTRTQEKMDAPAKLEKEKNLKRDKLKKALSGRYQSAENRTLRSTTEVGDLNEVFKLEKDLKALETELNNKLSSKYGYTGDNLVVKCDLKKQPLVIHCVSGTQPPIILYKIIQDPDGKHFEIKIKKDLRKLVIKNSQRKTRSGNYDYDAIEKQLDRREVVGNVFQKMIVEEGQRKQAIASQQQNQKPVLPTPATPIQKLEALQKNLAVLKQEPSQKVKEPAANLPQRILAKKQEILEGQKTQSKSDSTMKPVTQTPPKTPFEIKFAELKAESDRKKKGFFHKR